MVDFPHKIVVPQRPQHLVSRSRLNDLIGLIGDKRLITLSAPAGYGKTSLLIDFAHLTPLPICWYMIDGVDQDPWIFLTYLAASIEQRFPDSTPKTRATLRDPINSAFVSAVVGLAREIGAIGHDFVFVLDDWHFVDHIAEISEAVSQLIQRCPNSRFILASRNYPCLPNMMLLTARRQMCSLDERLLRFTPAEANAVLDAEYHATIPFEEANTLTEQSHGWITGILLLFQATNSSGISLFATEALPERQIYRFLVEQVFDQQPAELRQFLLDTALLEEITREACEKMLQRSDARSMLDLVLRRHLFISEIRPGVLRYHPLFREFLCEHYSTVEPARYQHIATEVAKWYAAQSQWMLAFELYIAAGMSEAAQEVIAVGGEQLYASGRMETLKNWFDAMSVDELDTPLLCLKARVLVKRGSYQEAYALAQVAETRMLPGEQPVVLLLQAQLARTAGHYDEAHSLAERVLSASDKNVQHAHALRTIGICCHRQGQTAVAIEKLREALGYQQHYDDPHAVAQLQRDLGICHAALGHLREAEEYYRQSDAYWAMVGNAGMRALSLNSIAAIEQLVGRYHDAYTTLSDALRRAREASLPSYEALVLSSLGDLFSDLQVWERATSNYQEAYRIGGSAHLLMSLDLAGIRLLVRQGHYETAARQIRQLSPAVAKHQVTTLCLLHGHVACGLGQYELAAQLAQESSATANEICTQIGAQLLLARIAAEVAPMSRQQVLPPLEAALSIANQFGYEAFLINEMLHFRTVLHCALALEWPPAQRWASHHQDILLIASGFDTHKQGTKVVIRTLGADKLLLNGLPIDLGWSKAREVFFYLLAHPAGATAEALREAIWPDLDPQRGSKTLSSAVYRLRSVLPREMIELQNRKLYQINRQHIVFDYDAERFLCFLDTCGENFEHLLEALNMYHGAYLESIDSQWCAGLRTLLEQRFIHALHLAGRLCEAHKSYAEAVIFYKRVLAIDGLDETAHTNIMRCHVAFGNRAAAIAQYQAMRQALDEELGLEPEKLSEVEQLYYHILHS